MPLRVKPVAEREIPIDPEPPRQGGVVDLRFKKQEEENWCWAACIEMVLKHYNLSKDEQCQIVQKALSAPGREVKCCTTQNISNDADLCNKTLDDGAITTLWKNGYGVEAEFKPRGIIFDPAPIRDELKDLLDKEQIVELGYSRPDVGNPDEGFKLGHVVILYGWEMLRAGRLNFLFHDPNTLTNASVNALNIGDLESGRLDATWKLPKLERQGG